MAATFHPPVYEGTGFDCPHCGTYAQQHFTREVVSVWTKHSQKNESADNGLVLRRCDKCDRLAVWHRKKLIVPRVLTGPPPHVDLPETPKEDYEEARAVAADSPRSAGALLRLALQKLCKVFGAKGDNIHTDIGVLVKKGLPAGIQKALDILRVAGNECVHPGIMDLRDDLPTVTKLFELVNLIVQNMITEPREIDALYSSLPESKRKEIERRDGQPQPAADPSDAGKAGS